MNSLLLVLSIFLSLQSYEDDYCRYDYNHSIINKMRAVTQLKRVPDKGLYEEINNHAVNCPYRIYDLLKEINYNHRMIKAESSAYFLKVNYEFFADIIIANSSIAHDINSPEIYTAYLIKSQKLKDIYCRFLTDTTHLWRKNRLPPGYFETLEMPAPFRVCDLALDGLIYLNNDSKIEYYQKFFDKSTFDLSINPIVAGDYKNLYDNFDHLNEVRDSLIKSILKQAESLERQNKSYPPFIYLRNLLTIILLFLLFLTFIKAFFSLR